MTKETGADGAGAQDGVGVLAETAPWSWGWWAALVWGAGEGESANTFVKLNPWHIPTLD